jgi:hypothetical protein
LGSTADADLHARLRCLHAYVDKRARRNAATVVAAASRSDDDSSKLSNGSASIRVTRDAFEHYVGRQLLMHPGEGATWLASVRAALLDEHNAHPTRELLLRLMLAPAAAPRKVPPAATAAAAADAVSRPRV